MISIADAMMLDFELPATLAARKPPEARGLARDAVRLMVSSVEDDSIVHRTFRRLPEFLNEGDILVVNTSATINAALAARRKNEQVGGAPFDAAVGWSLGDRAASPCAERERAAVGC
jgi:S-adenosylmethionine:tRNA-ribosyltransferase-isomerase (queuine synthetase)